jgi:hypothetical protein
MGETVEAVVPDEFDAWFRANPRVTNLERAEVYDVLLQALVRMMVSGGTHDQDYVRMLVEQALDPRWRGPLRHHMGRPGMRYKLTDAERKRTDVERATVCKNDTLWKSGLRMKLTDVQRDAIWCGLSMLLAAPEAAAEMVAEVMTVDQIRELRARVQKGEVLLGIGEGD